MKKQLLIFAASLLSGLMTMHLLQAQATYYKEWNATDRQFGFAIQAPFDPTTSDITPVAGITNYTTSPASIDGFYLANPSCGGNFAQRHSNGNWDEWYFGADHFDATHVAMVGYANPRPGVTGTPDILFSVIDPSTGSYYTHFRISGSGTDRGYAVCHTSDGGFLIVGSSSSGLPDADMVVIKIDPTWSTISWATAIGNPTGITGPDRAVDVMEVGGYYYVLGNTTTMNTYYTNDVCIARFDASTQAFVDVTTYEVNIGETAAAFDYDPINDWIGITGNTQSGYVSSQEAMYLRVKASTMNYHWYCWFSGSNAELWGTDIVYNPSQGGFAIAGYCRNYAFSIGGYDGFVMSYDDQSTWPGVYFQEVYGTSDDEFLRGIDFESTNNLFVSAGYKAQVSSPYDTDIITLSTDLSGDPGCQAVACTTVFSGTTPGVYTFTAADNIINSVSLSLNSHMKRYTLSIAENAACASSCKRGSLPGPETSTEQQAAVTLSPNPALQELNIALTGAWGAGVSVLDITGRQVMQYERSSDHFSLDLSNLQSGVYLLTLTDTNGFVHTEKFLKQ